jgi:cell division septation protein DedD
MASTSYDPLERDEPVPTSFGRRKRGGLGYFTLFVGGAAVIAMGVVGVFAYKAGERRGAEGVAPTIVAGAGPDKVRPEAPGGMEVPNQDKQVYENLLARGGAKPPQDTRLRPPPEAPMAPPRPPAIEQIPPLNAPPAAPQIAAAPELMRPEGAPPPQAAPAPAPAPVQATPAAPVPAPQTQELVKATTAAPAAGRAMPTGTYRVQIAALRSQEDADATIARIKRTNGDLINGYAFDVKRADLGDKGIYYRVQLGPLADASAAGALCDKLKDRKLGCVIVRP